MIEHLSIGEVLALLQAEFPDVTISKIRFLESQGLLDPERTPSGYRKFYEADIDRLRWILKQQRENFLPLKVIKVRLQGADGGEMDQLTMGQPGAALPGSGSTSADVGDGTGASPDDEAPVPIWMNDVTHVAERAKPTGPDPTAEQRRAPGPQPDPGEHVSGADVDTAARITQSAEPLSGAKARPAGPLNAGPLDSGPSTVSLSAEELARAAGIDLPMVQELERFGLLTSRPMGNDHLYDGDALVVAQKCAAFLARGLEPRHLRMFKVAVEREAGLLEQVVMPMLKQRNPHGRQEAVDLLGELALLGQQLRNALLRSALHDHLRPH